jgi:serine carboxypeptidase-like clade 1
VGTPARQRQLHYWLQLSERDPSKDPVILWLNGGPGASSIMYGALTEMGQLVHTSRSLRDNTTEVPLLAYNPHSWSRVASVIYLESPAGVGFSYCEYEPCVANDTTTAVDSFDFLTGFFKAYPELSANEFFLTGES